MELKTKPDNCQGNRGDSGLVLSSHARRTTLIVEPPEGRRAVMNDPAKSPRKEPPNEPKKPPVKPPEKPPLKDPPDKRPPIGDPPKERKIKAGAAMARDASRALF
jgi:hypothetical protein